MHHLLTHGWCLRLREFIFNHLPQDWTQYAVKIKIWYTHFLRKDGSTHTNVPWNATFLSLHDSLLQSARISKFNRHIFNTCHHKNVSIPSTVQKNCTFWALELLHNNAETTRINEKYRTQYEKMTKEFGSTNTLQWCGERERKNVMCAACTMPHIK